jgi:hypothetical protein
MGFNDWQKQQLRADLPRDVIMTKPGKAGAYYLPGWYVIDEANRIFGHDGWSFRVLEIREVYSGRKGPGDGANVLGAYEALVEVSVGGVVRQDVGLDAFDDPPGAVVSGIDKARKGSVTDGLKRCLRTFGMPLGLALYDKRNRHVGFGTQCLAYLAAVDALANDAEAVVWWRTHADLVARLDDDESAAVREHVAMRRRALVARPEPAQPAAVEPPPVAPPAPAVEPAAPVASPPPAPAAAPGGRTVDTVAAAIRDADTVERLREIPRLYADVRQTDAQRAHLTDLYHDRMLVLDPTREIVARARRTIDPDARDLVFEESASLYTRKIITAETHDLVTRLLTPSLDGVEGAS